MNGSNQARPKAVVFGYGDVGVRCTRVLLAGGIDVALVVTHRDNPTETIWFDSLAGLAAEEGLPAITPEDPKDPELHARVAAAAPDFIFSFYYRHMIPVDVLALARQGAFNMHGSLLPAFRGRAPVNWAVLKGATVSGASLHEMVAKPDAGAIVGQTAVPILPDDTAHDLFRKVAVAAELTLWNALPGLIDGSAPRLPNDLSRGSYFGARRPEDGRIDFTRPAQEVYNLIRAVAPPFPGAFFELHGERTIIAAARLAPGPARPDLAPGITVADNQILAICGDGRAVLVKRLVRGSDGTAIDAATLAHLLARP